MNIRQIFKTCNLLRIHIQSIHPRYNLKENQSFNFKILLHLYEQLCECPFAFFHTCVEAVREYVSGIIARAQQIVRQEADLATEGGIIAPMLYYSIYYCHALCLLKCSNFNFVYPYIGY